MTQKPQIHMLDDIAYWKEQIQLSPKSSNILWLIYAYYYNNEGEESIRQIESLVSLMWAGTDDIHITTALLLRDNIRADYAFVGSIIYNVQEDTILTDTLYQEVIEKYRNSTNSEEQEIWEVAQIRRILFQVSYGHFREIAQMYPDYIHFDETTLADDTLFSWEWRTAAYFDMYQLVVAQLLSALEWKSGKHYELCRFFLEMKRFERICMELSLWVTEKYADIHKNALKEWKKLLIRWFGSTNPEMQFLAYNKIYWSLAGIMSFEQHVELVDSTQQLIQELSFYWALYINLANLSFVASHYRYKWLYKKAASYYTQMVTVRRWDCEKKIRNTWYTLIDTLVKRWFCFLKVWQYAEAEWDFLEVIGMRASLSMDNYDHREFLMMAYGNLIESYLLGWRWAEAKKLSLDWSNLTREMPDVSTYYTVANLILWLTSEGDDEVLYMEELHKHTDILDWWFDEILLYAWKLPKEKQKKTQKIIDFLLWKIPREKLL